MKRKLIDNPDNLEQFIANLSEQKIQSFSTKSWIKMFENIENSGLSLNKHKPSFEKLYENYKMPKSIVASIKKNAQKSAKNLLANNQNLHSDIIYFNAITDQKRKIVLYKIKTAIYNTTLNNDKDILEPNIAYVDYKKIKNLGEYDVDEHKVYISKNHRKEAISTLAHELWHSLEFDSEKSLDQGKINSHNFGDIKELLEYNEAYYLSPYYKDNIRHLQSYRSQPCEKMARYFEACFARELYKQLGEKKSNFDICYNAIKTITTHSKLKNIEIGLKKEQLTITMPLSNITELKKVIKYLDGFEDMQQTKKQIMIKFPPADNTLKQKLSKNRADYMFSNDFVNMCNTGLVKRGQPAKIIKNTLTK